MNTNHRITGTTPMSGEVLLRVLQTSEETVVNVTTGLPTAGRFAGQTVVRLQGFRRTAAHDWGYDGREILIPARCAAVLAAHLADVGGSDATDSSPAPGR